MTFPSRDWRLSDADFQLIKEVFDQKDASKRTPQWLRVEIATLDESIAENLEKREESWKDAILILLQGRNFLARYIGDQERPIPAECYEGEVKEVQVPNPLKDKHVAIYSSMPLVGLALIQALTVNLPPTARFKVYDKLADLLKAILFGQVCGVIALHGRRPSSILGTFRHDLKNLPGQTYESAQHFLFPPCIDLPLPHNLLQIIRLISELEQGIYLSEAGAFDLATALPSLGVHMLVPEKHRSIIIVDDEPNMAAGMKRILEVWPTISVQYIQQTKGIPDIPLDADIILLDEMMANGLKGKEVVEWLRSKKFAGKVVSTTGGPKPDHVKHHFQQKGVIETSRQAAEAFVTFMNGLLY